MSTDMRTTNLLLARVLRDSGKNVNRAMRLVKEIIDDDLRKGRSPDRPFDMVLRINYERCMQLKGYQQRACSVYRKALPMFIKTYGEKSIHVKNVQTWLAEALETKQNVAEHKE